MKPEPNAADFLVLRSSKFFEHILQKETLEEIESQEKDWNSLQQFVVVEILTTEGINFSAKSANDCWRHLLLKDVNIKT